MEKRSSATARIVAVTTLVVAAIVVIVAIGSSVGGGDSNSGGNGQGGKTAHHAAKKKHHIPASYEIQSGDTLVSIAHETGVPVKEIEALNPEIDPQILIAGETLKLR
jgi:LysM repeat protein